MTSAEPPQPMSLVRLLIRDGDAVFCVPREGAGKLDLPTRHVRAGDPSGVKTVRELCIEVTGGGPLSFVGAVRNIVPDPPGDYAWPAPTAHFGVWQTERAPRIDGQWLDVRPATTVLSERHWYPLLRRGLELELGLGTERGRNPSG